MLARVPVQGLVCSCALPVTQCLVFVFLASNKITSQLLPPTGWSVYITEIHTPKKSKSPNFYTGNQSPSPTTVGWN